VWGDEEDDERKWGRGGSSQSHCRQASPLDRGPTKQELDRIHEEQCPDYTVGCISGFRYEHMHDYTKTTSEQQTRMLDILIGQVSEMKRQLHWVNYAVEAMSKELHLDIHDIQQGYRRTRKRDSSQLRKRAASLSRHTSLGRDTTMSQPQTPERTVSVQPIATHVSQVQLPAYSLPMPVYHYKYCGHDYPEHNQPWYPRE
jgi:hypothetical protein